MNIFSLRSTLIPLLTAVTMIAACSKSESPATASPQNAAPAVNGQANIAALTQPGNIQNVKNKALPTGDPHYPLSDYRTLQSGNDLMFLYYGISNLPVDYEKVAQSYSQDYRSTQDNFKKHDMLVSLKPRIDAEIQSANSHRYVALTVNGISMNAYDFDHKGFKLNNFGDAGMAQFFFDNATYKAEYTNGPDYVFLHVPDDTAARQIETLRSQFKPLTLQAYAYVQDADPATDHVKMQILHVRLVDGNNQVLAEN